MNLNVLLPIFGLVFLNELGDKTQIAAGTSTLANRRQTTTIFISSSLALMLVAGITVFAAGFIPKAWQPALTIVGGCLLVIYGIYLFSQAAEPEIADNEVKKKNGASLFFSQFIVVFLAELGDKTMIATLAAALQNPADRTLVFVASASALIAVTGLTVFIVTKIPLPFVKYLQRLGAVLMIAYGIYMLF